MQVSGAPRISVIDGEADERRTRSQRRKIISGRGRADFKTKIRLRHRARRIRFEAIAEERAVHADRRRNQRRGDGAQESRSFAVVEQDEPRGPEQRLTKQRSGEPARDLIVFRWRRRLAGDFPERAASEGVRHRLPVVQAG